MYTLFYNGIISTGPNTKRADTLVALGEKIIFIGSGSQINLPEKLVRRVDLNGGHVVPGFIDAHTHVAGVALYAEQVSLHNCVSRAEALDQIRAAAQKDIPGEWLQGGGWDANLWPDGKPHRQLLDEIIPDRPVALYSKDSHCIWLNSLAFERCGFGINEVYWGRKIGRDETGAYSGLVYEDACTHVAEMIGPAEYDQLERCLDDKARELYALGITSVHSCEGQEVYSHFKQMHRNGKLPLRVTMHPPQERAGSYIEAGIFSGDGDDWLRMGGLKYFVDGSLGSQTAEMFEPFDEILHSGIEVMDAGELRDKVVHAAINGLAATIHAIGDKANYKALQAIAAARLENTPFYLRHRIEHAQIIRPQDIALFREHDVTAVIQPLHITDDVRIAQKYLGERAANAYPVRSLLDAGVKVAFSSDMPVADPDPLKGIRAAVSRRYLLRADEPEWNPVQQISAAEALDAYTSGAAWASGEENRKGKLANGYLADFAVLNNDPRTADEAVLADTRVMMTVLAGEVVYRREPIS
jgi:predicted amidohydrolase YtcJ